MYIKIPTAWKKINEIYIKTSSGWKKIIDGYIKTANGWKKFWSSILAPQSPVEISLSMSPTNGLVTLTGTNYFWSPGPPSLVYYFSKSSNNITYTDFIGPLTISNPAYGSSNTVTANVTANDVTKNSINYYKFRVEATNNPLTGSSTSNYAAFQAPTNITLTLGAYTSDTVNLSWTSSSGANRYYVYKSTDNSTWTFYAGTNSSTTSITITGLTNGTLYYFKVIPVTGPDNNNPGYYGNDSNVVSVTTLITPGAISSLTNYNFATGKGAGFFTTGTNTTKVRVTWVCDSIPLYYPVPTFEISTISSRPYQFETNILSYFTLKTWSSTTTYNPGDYVLYSGQYYFCIATTTGNLPTNSTYWNANQLLFRISMLPYNNTEAGSIVYASRQMTLSVNSVNDPLTISSGPTFSNITTTSFRTTFVPSTYTNEVDFYIYNTSTSTYVTNYNPKVLSVSGATSTIHDTTTTLSSSTQYLVTINSRYVYNSTYSIYYNGSGASAYVTTATPISASNPSVSDTTATPSSAFGFSMSSATNNVGTVSWSNGSPSTTAWLYSVTGSGSGGSTTDPGTKNTSGTFTILSTGTATATVRQVNKSCSAAVSWSQSGAQSYTVTYNQSGVGSGLTSSGNSNLSNPTVTLATGIVAGTSITITNITVYSSINQTGSSYSLPVSSVSVSVANKAIDTSYSGNVTYTSPVPGLPTSLSATTTRTDGVSLTFSGSSGATSYDLFWNTAQGAYPSPSSTPDFTAVSSPYLDTTISSGSTRWYWVRGRNSYGTSDWYPYQTNGVTGTRATATLKPPNDPTGLTTPSSGTSPNLVFNNSSWTAPAVDATHNAATYYQVYIEASTSQFGTYYPANNTFSYNYYPGSPLTTSTNANTAATAATVYATAIYSGTVTDTTRAYTWVRMWVRAANADGYSNWVSKDG